MLVVQIRAAASEWEPSPTNQCVSREAFDLLPRSVIESCGHRRRASTLSGRGMIQPVSCRQPGLSLHAASRTMNQAARTRRWSRLAIASCGMVRLLAASCSTFSFSHGGRNQLASRFATVHRRESGAGIPTPIVFRRCGDHLANAGNVPRPMPQATDQPGSESNRSR
jgi:hypothetical protein